MTDNPFEALGYAVITQAIEDVRMFQKFKVIVDGEVSQFWPKRRGKPVKLDGYSKPHEVKELLLWFRNGSLERLLDLLDSSMNPIAIREAIQI